MIRRMYCVSILAVLCTACGMNLRPAPLSGALSLNGSWQLSQEQRHQAVDQLRAALKQAADKQARQERKRGFAPPPDRDNPGHENWEMREQREQREALANFAVPPQTFNVAQTAGRIDITSDGGARRSFTSGESSTLVTTFGSFHIESGWQNDEFVVHSKDRTDGIDLLERYRRSTNSLTVTITLSASEMKAQTVVLNYASQH